MIAAVIRIILIPVKKKRILEKMADVKRQQKTQKDCKEWKEQNQGWAMAH